MKGGYDMKKFLLMAIFLLLFFLSACKTAQTSSIANESAVSEVSQNTTDSFTQVSANSAVKTVNIINNQIQTTQIEWDKEKGSYYDSTWLDDDNVIINYSSSEDHILHINRYNISTNSMVEVSLQNKGSDFLGDTHIVKGKGNSFALCGSKGALIFENDKLVKEIVKNEEYFYTVSPDFKYEVRIPILTEAQGKQKAGVYIKDLETGLDIDFIEGDSCFSPRVTDTNLCAIVKGEGVLIYNLETREKAEYRLDMPITKLQWNQENDGLYITSGDDTYINDYVFKLVDQKVKKLIGRSVEENSVYKYAANEYLMGIIYSNTDTDASLALYDFNTKEMKKELCKFPAPSHIIEFDYSPSRAYINILYLSNDTINLAILAH